MPHCRICNKLLKQITNTHLKSHSITIDDYKLAHPDAELVDEATRTRMSEQSKIANSSRKGVPRSKEVVEKMREAARQQFANGRTAHNKGKSMSDAQKQKMSEIISTQYQDGREHWNNGKVHSTETKDKISSTLVGREVSATARTAISEGLQNYYASGGTGPMSGKKHTNSTRFKLSEALKRRYQHKESITREQLDAIASQNCITIKEVINNYYVHMVCDICDTEFEFTKQVFRPSKNNGENLCPTCYPRESGTSKKEEDFANFIKSVYTGLVVTNDRKVLGGKEIDVYIPDLNIGFEFTGLYWHSEVGGKLDKHHLLWKKQHAHTKGVSLYTVFEDEWDDKRDIVMSRIKSILKLLTTTCYARTCSIQKIDNSSKDNFLDTHHIQGKDISGIRYGAFYDGVLVGVMTFTKTSFVKGGTGIDYELNRFCLMSGCHIPGIASRLLKAFIRDYTPTTIISYADSRWSNGGVYRQLGFKYSHSSPPSYWYLEGYKTKYHRSKFMKHSLRNLQNFSDDKTEWEIMVENGYDRIWDCGTTKWTMTCS